MENLGDERDVEDLQGTLARLVAAPFPREQKASLWCMKSVIAVEKGTMYKLFYKFADYPNMETEIKANDKSTLKKHGSYGWKHRKEVK